jgi:PAS domain S-box-containing protein
MPIPAMLLVGAEHRFNIVNEAARRMSGGRAVIGRTPQEVFPELVAQGFLERCDRVHDTGAPSNSFETRVRAGPLGAGLQDSWFELRLNSVRDRQGRTVAMLLLGADVTEQVRTRELLDQVLIEREAVRAGAEAARRTQLESLAVMSHELRTPLQAIGGYVELMELGIHGVLTADQRSDLAGVSRGQRHLLSLVNRALASVTSDAYAVQDAAAPVPLDEVFSACDTLTAPLSRAKGIRVRYITSDLRLRPLANLEQVQQILINLVGNAIKFTEPGGCVTVDATADGGDGVDVRVTDTGCGIAADQLQRIFVPFVQLNGAGTHTPQGTGLGLAISRDLARHMGGDLTAHSTIGGGSTFVVTLPATTPDPLAASKP